MGIYVKLWHFLRCPLPKYGHVTRTKKQILFFPNSAFNIRKSYKISSRKAIYVTSYQPKTSRGVETPLAVLLGLNDLCTVEAEPVKIAVVQNLSCFKMK